MAGALIVLSHPAKRSFTGDWAAASAEGLVAAGYDVVLSDLYRMGFDPVLGEKESSAPHIRPEAEAELRKVEAADVLVFHFPIWWFGPPAILKGWFDRVLVHGRLYDSRHMFDRGHGRGKTALFCVNAGADASQIGHDGNEGDLRLILWPLAHALRFCGITVLEPHIEPGVSAHGDAAARSLLESRLSGLLERHRERIGAIDRLPVWASNPDSDFDDDHRLKPGAPVFSPFIRHRE